MPDIDLSKLRIDKAPLTTGARRRRLPWIIAVIVVLLLLVFLALQIFRPTVSVTTATVTLIYPSQTFTLLNASGYVVPQRKAAVAAKATGRLEWLGVEEGSRVRQGEVIARLESQDTEAARQQAVAALQVAKGNLAGAEADLMDAQRGYRRMQELIGQGIVSQSDYDAAEARFHTAQATRDSATSSVTAAGAALKGAEVNLEYALIRAPFDAVVLTKNADIGDIVTPIGAAAEAKAAVVTIADMSSLQVEADVSESNLAKVHPGQPCEITLDAIPDQRFPGVVHMVVPTADRTKASIMVKVRVLKLDTRILPEMSARVAFLEHAVQRDEQQPRIAVPPAAIVTINGSHRLFVIRKGRAVAVPITTGKPIGDLLEVTSGVTAGDKVVLKPLDRLKDGIRVKEEGA
ncbi:MAG TPA: efflux RND transporter periplasmic adaptor subunit [Geobacterales bacterium]|nr:efflux RND transporter periplasmic adaptor subunit [Geobacterales bacterium]